VLYFANTHLLGERRKERNTTVVKLIFEQIWILNEEKFRGSRRARLECNSLLFPFILLRGIRERKQWMLAMSLPQQQLSLCSIPYASFMK
jgi:hypothetical protein